MNSEVGFLILYTEIVNSYVREGQNSDHCDIGSICNLVYYGIPTTLYYNGNFDLQPEQSPSYPIPEQLKVEPSRLAALNWSRRVVSLKMVTLMGFWSTQFYVDFLFM